MATLTNIYRKNQESKWTCDIKRQCSRSFRRRERKNVKVNKSKSSHQLEAIRLTTWE